MQQQAKTKTSSDTSAQEQPGLQVNGTVLNNLGQDVSLALNVIETKTGLSQGSWAQLPPAAIQPGGSGEFTVAGGLGGAAGHAVYNVLVNGTSSGTALLTFSIPGQNPDSDGAGISVPPGLVGEVRILLNSPPMVNLAYILGVAPQ